MDWTHEHAPDWDSLGTVAESWTASLGTEADRWVCRIDHDTAGGWAYTVSHHQETDSGGYTTCDWAENVTSGSFAAAEQAIIALLAALRRQPGGETSSLDWEVGYSDDGGRTWEVSQDGEEE